MALVRRASGRLVKVTRKSGGSFTARLVQIGDDAALLADPESGTVTEIPYDEVSRAVVQVEFSAPAPELLAQQVDAS